MSIVKRGGIAAALVALVPLGAWVAGGAEMPGAPVPAASMGSLSPAVTDVELEDLIASLTVVETLPKVAGYERECGKESSCVFGTAWTDKYEGRDARNGCDTRNDVLGQQLVDVRFKPGTNNCKVIGGTLYDPFTGTMINFDPKKPSAIQIDHTFALSRAWSAGAASWSQDKRVNFANDTERNLLAVDGPANQSKGDKGPGEWMPKNASYQCEYGHSYMTVAAAYDLAVTTDDVAAARAACG